MDKPFDAVFFDVGHTLVWFYPSAEDLVLRAWQEAGLNVSRERLTQASGTVWREYYKDADTVCFPATREYDQGAWMERQRRLMLLLGQDDEELLQRVTQREHELFGEDGAIRVYEDVVPALEALQEADYRLGVISNWSWNLRDRLRQTGLLDYFEVIMASAYAGCNKPHRGIFEQALEQMGAPARRAVHVGDVYEADVVGARAAGMLGVLLDRKGPADLLAARAAGKQGTPLDRERPADGLDCPVVSDLCQFIGWIQAQDKSCRHSGVGREPQ